MAGETREQVSPGRRHIIKRPRLTKTLDESASRVQMLVAPAGYGKTTLAREWLENRWHGWYQGGPASADVAALAVGLAEVCAAIVPGAGDRMRARLRATSSPEDDVEPLGELLAEDIVQWPEDAWLAIDDYQYATASPASERFVELLYLNSPVRLLVATRERPSWSTSRQWLYGEIHELSRASLAMDQDEVAEILEAVGRGRASGLLALANGWPAVIGLAAFAPEVAVPDDIPEALYEFFAQELLRALDEEVQKDILTLAIPQSISLRVAEFLLGQRAEEVVVRAEHIGVLTRGSKELYSMHPLLRHFLLDRLERTELDLSELATRLFRFFATERAWDEAFSVLQTARLPNHVPALVEAALPSVLANQRLSTLGRWVEYAEADGIHSPILDVALAELACRGGDASRAQALAEHAARALSPGDPLIPQVLLLAGKAALLSNRTQRAVSLYESARGVSTSDADAYEATWGQFVSAARLENPEVTELIRQLDAMAGGVPDRELRRATARMIVGARMGSLCGLDELLDSMVPLLSRVTDPFVRSSFLIARAQLLALSGKYLRALAAAEQAFQDVRDYRFEFLVPHAAMVKALVHLGLRQISQASALIADSERLGEQRGDAYVKMNVGALRARLLLHQGSSSKAVSVLSRPWSSLPERSMHAEYLATRALALACNDEREAALKQAEESACVSQGVEAAVLNAAARAIANIQTDSTESDVASLFGTATRTGNYDGLLFACRLSSALAEQFVSDTTRGGVIAKLIHETGDYVLARRLKLLSAARPSTDALTPREHEVYELLALGLTNKEIASALFITETTAKAHSLHVREKLGLRSRTEVALHASSRGGSEALTQPSMPQTPTTKDLDSQD